MNPNPVTAFAYLLIGAIAGGFVTYLYCRTRLKVLEARVSLADQGLLELERLRQQLQETQAARYRAEETAARVPGLEQQIAELQNANTRLAMENAELRKECEKIQWLEQSEQRLRETFKALAAEILRSNAEDLLNRSEVILKPLAENLRQLENHLRELEQKREGSYRALDARIKDLIEAHTQLQRVTDRLHQALKSSTVRGKWGEYQLRRIVELAGMTEHVDFEEQPVSEESGRPDMIIHLPNGGVIPVDAKAPMDDYLRSLEAPDEQKSAFLDAHAKAVRARLKELGQRKYWDQFKNAPEIVIMFVPSEACLSTAFEKDPELFDFALQQRVLPASPVTLLAVLKSVAFVWQQHKFEENAKLIAEAGRELHKYLIKLLEHFQRTGRHIEATVKSYNETVENMEKSLIPRIRKFMDLSQASESPPDLNTVNNKIRIPTSSPTDDSTS